MSPESEIEELRAKAMASLSNAVAPNPYSKSKVSSPGGKEEGELSSSSSEDKPVKFSSSAAPLYASTSVGAADPNSCSATLSASVSAAAFRGADPLISHNKALKRQLITKNMSRPPRPQQSLGRGVVRPPATSKPIARNHSWSLSSRNNDDLVIRFSDDDSGSDSDERRSEKSQESTKVGRDNKISNTQRPATAPAKTTNPEPHIKKHIEITEKVLPVQTARSYSTETCTPNILEKKNPCFQGPCHLQVQFVPEKDSGHQGSSRKQAGPAFEGRSQQTVTKEAKLKQQASASETKETTSNSHANYHHPKIGCKDNVATTSASLTDQMPAAVSKQIDDYESHELPREDLRMSGLIAFEQHLSTDMGQHLMPDTAIRRCNVEDDQEENSQTSNTSTHGNFRATKRLKLMSSASLVEKHQRSSEYKSTGDKKNAMELGFLPCINQVQHGDPGQSSTDVQSLIETEELLDKELEDAQEFRHHCELEERVALKAYRAAQRALISANNRCVLLYRRREEFSNQLRSFLVDNHFPSSSGCRELQVVSNMFPKLPGQFLDILHHNNYETGNDVAGDSHMQFGTDHSSLGALVQKDDHANGCTIVKDGDGRPVLSLGENIEGAKGTGICNGGIFSIYDASADGNQIPLLHQELDHEIRLEVDAVKGETSTAIVGYPGDDPASLEATLRSKLFARLGSRMLPPNGGSNSGGDNASVGTSESFEKQTDSPLLIESVLPLEEERSCRDIEAHSSGIQRITPYLEKERDGFYSSNIRCSDNGESCSTLHYSCGVIGASDVGLPSSAWNIVFKHVISSLPDDSRDLLAGNVPEECTRNLMYPEDLLDNEYKVSPVVFSFGLRNNILGSEKMSHVDGVTSVLLDPFWPVCMFETRGRCNDKECPWQHLRDHNCKNTVAKYTLTCSQPAGAKYLDMLVACNVPIPSYAIGSEVIDADTSLLGHVLSQNNLQFWHTSFCSIFSFPCCIQRALPRDCEMLCQREAIEVADRSMSKLSIYVNFLQDYLRSEVNQVGDPEKILDAACEVYSRMVNKIMARKLALSAISRSLEENPSNVSLWVIYLLIFYKQEKSLGTDDMFHHSILQTEDFYELWIMYINSRETIGKRLKAYDTAISKLCLSVQDVSRKNKHTSACILDLFLRKLDCLCMCGWPDKAISGINKLRTEDGLLSDMLYCFVASDRCILLVCCAYFLVYGKLPDCIVQRFEFAQDLPLGIEWPLIKLSELKRNQALEFMDFSMKVFGDQFQDFDHEEEFLSNAQQALAINHIKCVSVLSGLKFASDLVDKYRKLFPTCIELLLLSAQMHSFVADDADFAFLEKCLLDWPKGVPGVQSIWNQYAHYAMTRKGVAFVKVLMTNWYEIHAVDVSVDTEKNGFDGSGFHATLSRDPRDADNETYKLLNLALYRLLHGNFSEAQCALSKAIKIASPRDFKHIIREYAAFSLSRELSSNQDVLDDGMLGFFSGYLVDVRMHPTAEPLSRNFLDGIKRTKLRHLITSIMGPVSKDCSALNSILEDFYGHNLLPESNDIKALVDFVGPLMDLLPSNHRLALSVCERLSGKFNPASMSSVAALFWASSVLISSICQAYPTAPEKIWLEAAEILKFLIMR